MKKEKEVKKKKVGRDLGEDIEINVLKVLDSPQDLKDLEDTRRHQIVHGQWTSVDEVARDVWSGIHSSLLQGQPLFAYKSTKPGSELVQVVVVMNLKTALNGERVVVDDDLAVGLITTGWTALLPHVPSSYLVNDLHADLVKYKVEKKIIETFEQIVTDYIKIYGKEKS